MTEDFIPLEDAPDIEIAPELSKFTQGFLDRAYEKVNREGYLSNLWKAVQAGISPVTFHDYMQRAKQDLQSIDSGIGDLASRLDSNRADLPSSEGVQQALNSNRDVSNQVPPLPRFSKPVPGEFDLLAATLANAVGATGRFGADVATAPYFAAQNNSNRDNALAQAGFVDGLNQYRAGTAASAKQLAAEQNLYQSAVETANQYYSRRRQGLLDQLGVLRDKRSEASGLLESGVRRYETARTLDEMQSVGAGFGFTKEQIERDYAARNFDSSSDWPEAVRLGRSLGLSESGVRERLGAKFAQQGMSEWMRTLGQAKTVGLDGATVDRLRNQVAQRHGLNPDSLPMKTDAEGLPSELLDFSRSTMVDQAVAESKSRFQQTHGRSPSPQESNRLALEAGLEVQNHRIRMLNYRLMDKGQLSKSEQQAARAELAERDRILGLIGTKRP